MLLTGAGAIALTRAGHAITDNDPGTQRQSAEAVRRVRDVLIKVGAKLISDNVYALELDNGSRVLALPGSDNSIRGLTVDAWIVADEAARLSEDTIAAPCARCAPAARRRGSPCYSGGVQRADPF